METNRTHDMTLAELLELGTRQARFADGNTTMTVKLPNGLKLDGTVTSFQNLKRGDAVALQKGDETWFVSTVRETTRMQDEVELVTSNGETRCGSPTRAWAVVVTEVPC